MSMEAYGGPWKANKPSKGAACVRAVILAIDQTKMRKINAIRAAPTPVAIKA